MPSPRLLVIEGNSPQHGRTRGRRRDSRKPKAIRSLTRIAARARSSTSAIPVDPAAALPEGGSLEEVRRHRHHGFGPAVYNGGRPGDAAQVDLVRAALSTGTPVFGSCWGLQVIVAATGRQRAQESLWPRDRFRPRIRLTEAAASIDVVGSSTCSDAPTCSRDRYAAGGTSRARQQCVRRAGRRDPHHSGRWPGQCSTIRISVARIGAIVRRIGTRLIGEGFLRRRDRHEGFARTRYARPRSRLQALAWRHGIAMNVLDQNCA